MSSNIDKQRISSIWIKSSERDWKTMQRLYKSKDYVWTLFLGHLVLEKLIKAIIVKQTGEQAPFSHSLAFLVKKTKLQISEERLDWLEEITGFNLNARYDNFKDDFYKRCTKQFAMVWIDKIKLLRVWLKKELLK